MCNASTNAFFITLPASKSAALLSSVSTAPSSSSPPLACLYSVLVSISQLVMSVGASRLPLGASCLVVLGHLVSCYAQDFAPVPALVEAYLGLLSLTSSLASKEHCSAKPGRHHHRLDNPRQPSRTKTPGDSAAQHRLMHDEHRQQTPQTGGMLLLPLAQLTA